MADRAEFTILSMMKDEGPSLVEWVAYHRAAGADRIVVYTNDCTDGTDLMLMRMEEMGLVRHRANDVPPGRKPQPNALTLAESDPAVTESDWIVVMDADEFVAVKTGMGRLQDLVASLPASTDAVAVTWRMFGSNGLRDWNPGLVTESYTRAAPDTFKKGWGVKTLFRPFAHMKFGIHRPSIHGARSDPARARALHAQTWVNGSGQPMPDDFTLSGWRSTRPTLGYDLVEMNHYAVKSREAYLLRRLRGNVNLKQDKYDAAYFALFDRNEEKRATALRHLPEVKRLMAEWLSDPRLARLHEAALTHHAARIDALRGSGEYDARMAELDRAARVPFDRLDEVLFTGHLPKAWQDKIAEMRAAGVPDRVLAAMIARSKSARKSETRAEIRAAASAGGPPAAEEPGGARDAPLADARTPDAGTPEARPLAAPPAASRRAPRLHLVSTLRNEAPYLVEWIAHHRAAGITDITVFSNDCTDGTNLMLDRLQAMGVLRHFDNPLGPRMDPQRRAYSRANRMAEVRAADWVLIVDADEFVNVHAGDRTLPALLEETGHPDALSLGWRLMGSGGAARWIDAPVTRRFIRGCSLDRPENVLVRGFKTLFRPAAFDYFGVHRPKFEKDREHLPDLRWLNGSGAAMSAAILRRGWRFPAGEDGYALGQINHYAVKSREEFLLKRLRGTANSKNRDRIDLDYWKRFDLNTEPDATIETERAEAEAERLLADPDLAGLRRAALATARRTLEAELEDDRLRDFVEAARGRADAAD